jgi:TonB family protein
LLDMTHSPGWNRRDAIAVGVAILLASCGPTGPVDGPELQPVDSQVEYPIELWDMGVEGETTLMLHVTEAGQVDSVYVHATSGIPEFDSAAVQAGRQMRFSPARRGGERIPAWTRVPIKFQRTAETPPSSATTPAEPGQEGN